MDYELVCNFKKCRKRISTFSWVTSCSHIFCDEDGTREFNKAYTCPACDTNLPNKFDILRTDIQPTEQYKSMVLAGQKPETIMEICSRAMAFWTYQTHQERCYQEYVVNKSKEKVSQLEFYYEQILTQTQTELNTLKSNLSASRKDLDEMKKRYNEVSEKIMDKNRQYQKLQGLYDALRRRCIVPSNMDADSGHTPSRQTHQRAFTIATTADDILRRGGAGQGEGSSPAELILRRGSSGGGDREGRFANNSPAEREFVFRPNSTPTLGGETRPGRPTAVQSRFNMEMGTPKSRHPKS